MTDVRSTGKPETGKREARLSEDGTLTNLSIQVSVPDGHRKEEVLCWFDVEDGVATLYKVTACKRGDEEDLKKLRVSRHLPGILAAEMAAQDLEQVRDVRGVETLLDEAKTQAQYGYKLPPCDDCGEEAWGVDAAEAGEEHPGSGLACPECGSTSGLR